MNGNFDDLITVQKKKKKDLKKSNRVEKQREEDTKVDEKKVKFDDELTPEFVEKVSQILYDRKKMLKMFSLIFIHFSKEKTFYPVDLVYETIKYDIFGFFTQNRDRKETHILRLVKKIFKKNLLIPIVVNIKLQIIEGQHRVEAFKRIVIKYAKFLPIRFIIREDLGIEDFSDINNGNLAWRHGDFLHNFSERGLESYIRFIEFDKKSEIMFPDTFGQNEKVTLCAGRINFTARNTTEFKNGLFKFSASEEEVIEQMNEVYTYLQHGSFELIQNREFQAAIWNIKDKYPLYDRNIMGLSIRKIYKNIQNNSKSDDIKTQLIAEYNDIINDDEKLLK